MNEQQAKDTVEKTMAIINRKPKTSKPIKLYTSIQSGNGWTSKSVGYYHGVSIMNLAAKSINQAYYFAHHDVWFDAKTMTGILERTCGNEQWIAIDTRM